MTKEKKDFVAVCTHFVFLHKWKKHVTILAEERTRDPGALFPSIKTGLEQQQQPSYFFLSASVQEVERAAKRKEKRTLLAFSALLEYSSLFSLYTVL